MENITIFLLIFIILFLLYSYLNFKKNILKKEIKEEKISSAGEEKENFEKHIIAAIIAAFMDGKNYKIRNIFLEKNEIKKSAWRISGRDYNMQRRDRI